LIIEKHEQKCTSATYMELGWLETMVHKVDIVIRGIKENWNKIFIHSDVDIQFFRPTKDMILKYMAGNDIAIQKVHPAYNIACAGFFACRGNEKTLALWLKVRELLIEAMKDPVKAKARDIHDQSILNFLINQSNPYDIKWSYFPREFYGTEVIDGGRWTPGKEIDIPEKIVMHHAIWTTGLENKHALLTYVRDYVGNNLIINSHKI
jgi:hypothetical protein